MLHSKLSHTLFSTLLFCSLSAADVLAGEDTDLFELDLEQLLQVHVETLNKRPQKYLQLPAAIYILDRQEIERSGAATIPDLLSRIPGVFVKQLSSDMVAVAIRNDIKLYSTNLLVLIDGSPYYNQGTSNGSWDILPVAVEDVERIEVIRGDGGTTWGTNSSGGVVNIITRSPDSEPRARISGSGGMSAPFRAHGVTSTGKLRLSAHNAVDHGWSDDPGSSRKSFLTARYDTRFSGWDTTLIGRYLEKMDYDVVGNYTGRSGDGGSRSYDAGMTISRRVGDDSLHLKAFVYEIKADLPAEETSDILQRLTDLEGRYSHRFSADHRTQVALDYRHYVSRISEQQFLQQSAERIQNSLVNVTVDHESRLDQDTTLNVGLRYERFDLFTDQDGLWSFSLRLARQLSEETVLWASVNQSYQFPAYVQSDFSGLVSVSDNRRYFHKGNPNLKPENNRTAEIGLRSLLGNGIFVDLSGYYGEVRDEIIIDPAMVAITPVGPVDRYDIYFSNHIRSRFWGAEMLLGWDISEAWHTDLGLTIFQRDSEEQDGLFRGAINDQYAPPYKLTLDSRYQFSDTLDLSLSILYEPSHNYQSVSIYIPGKETESHLRVNGSLNYRFSEAGALSVGFRNLFNSHVEWDYSYGVTHPVQVEPSIYLKLSYQW